MGIIKCACGSKHCKIQLVIEDERHWMITDKNGDDTLMYFDSKTISQLRETIQLEFDSSAESAEARAAALESERDGWIAKLQAYDEIEKANKALAAELVKLRALYTNCAVALTKHGDQYLTLTVREGIEAMAAELERVKAERDKLAQENAEAVERQQLKTWYQARMSGDRRGFDEWQAETPLGQALDGLGDEVEP